MGYSDLKKCSNARQIILNVDVWRNIVNRHQIYTLFIKDIDLDKVRTLMNVLIETMFSNRSLTMPVVIFIMRNIGKAEEESRLGRALERELNVHDRTSTPFAGSPRKVIKKMNPSMQKNTTSDSSIKCKVHRKHHKNVV